MQHLAHQFTQTLGREADLYRVLLAELARERQALLDSDLVSIQTVVAAKRKLLGEIEKIEEGRLALQRRMAALLGFPGDDLSLSRLLTRVGTPFKRQLQATCAAIQEVLPRIRELQRRNRMLVRHGLKLVSHSLDFLSRGSPACCVYHASGRLQYGRHAGRLLCSSI